MREYIKHPFAVIYPIPSNFALRIFKEKKSVFAKYGTHEVLSQNVTDCKKLLIYESSTGQKITGEADVLSVQLMNFSEVISEYKKEFFLSEDEFRAYASGREEKKMMVFKLDNIKEYSAPIIFDHKLTVAGEYISKDEYNRLTQNS